MRPLPPTPDTPVASGALRGLSYLLEALVPLGLILFLAFQP